MAFDKEEVKQLETILDKRFDSFEKVVDQKFDAFEVKVDQKFEDQRSILNYDFKVMIKYEIKSIKEDLEKLQEKVDRIFKTESEDVKLAYDLSGIYKNELKEWN